MLHPVILCGGYGTRLWPLSRTNLPKQFLRVFGDKSLFQHTLDRIERIDAKVATTYVVTNHKQKYLVHDQLEATGFKNAKIFLEPKPLSTSPAITLTALEIFEKDPEGIIIALSSDNEIRKSDVFIELLSNAAKVAGKYEKLLLFSSKPKYVETGYGYIKGGDVITSKNDNVKIQKIEHFKEKPSYSEAEALIKADYQWNSGIFILPVKLYLDEMRKYANDIVVACEKILAGKTETYYGQYNFTKFKSKDYAKCREDSIDYALIEHTDKAAVVKTDIGWYDVGTWQTIYEISPKDADGNVINGEVIVLDSKNSHIYSTDDHRLIAAIGLENITVIQTNDSTLVMPTKRSQDVKKVTSALAESGKSSYLTNLIHYTSWGSYEVIRGDKRFKLKKVTIKLGHKIFIKANSKAKHFIVTNGEAEFKFGTSKLVLKKNESLMILKDQDYTITNLDKGFLEIVKMETKDFYSSDKVTKRQSSDK